MSLNAPSTPVAEGTAQPPDLACTTDSVCPLAESLVPSRSQPKFETNSTTDALLLQLVEQLRECNERFSAFADEQRIINSEMREKLDRLSDIAGVVERNSQRIASLE